MSGKNIVKKVSSITKTAARRGSKGSNSSKKSNSSIKTQGKPRNKNDTKTKKRNSNSSTKTVGKGKAKEKDGRANRSAGSITRSVASKSSKSSKSSGRKYYGKELYPEREIMPGRTLEYYALNVPNGQSLILSKITKPRDKQVKEFNELFGNQDISNMDKRGGVTPRSKTSDGSVKTVKIRMDEIIAKKYLDEKDKKKNVSRSIKYRTPIPIKGVPVNKSKK